MKLSIVIPAYNIQDYIRKCLDSCVKAAGVSDEEYEIIVVNDGATDDTLKKAKEYSLQYNNVAVVTRKNGGLSAARNTGLQNAKGDYVWFVDGDDYITPDAVSTIFHDIEYYGCDILTYGYNKIVDGINVGSVQMRTSDELLNAHEEFLKCNFGFPMLVWTHVYRRAYLMENGLIFCEGIIHEDLEYKFRSHFPSSSILMSSKIIYNYRLSRIGSIMSNAVKNPQRSIDSNDIIIKRFLDYCEINKVPDNVKRRYLGDLSLLAMERIFDQDNDIVAKNRGNIKKLSSYLWRSPDLKRRVFSAICFCLPIPFVRFIQHYYQKKRNI